MSLSINHAPIPMPEVLICPVLAIHSPAEDENLEAGPSENAPGDFTCEIDYWTLTAQVACGVETCPKCQRTFFKVIADPLAQSTVRRGLSDTFKTRKSQHIRDLIKIVKDFRKSPGVAQYLDAQKGSGKSYGLHELIDPRDLSPSTAFLRLRQKQDPLSGCFNPSFVLMSILIFAIYICSVHYISPS